MKSDQPFALTHGDKHNSLWTKLRAHFEAERAIARERNDSLQLDEKQTAATRGRIQQLTELIALGD